MAATGVAVVASATGIIDGNIDTTAVNSDKAQQARILFNDRSDSGEVPVGSTIVDGNGDAYTVVGGTGQHVIMISPDGDTSVGVNANGTVVIP